jgi:hypothetical protein
MGKRGVGIYLVVLVGCGGISEEGEEVVTPTTLEMRVIVRDPFYLILEWPRVAGASGYRLRMQPGSEVPADCSAGVDLSADPGSVEHYHPYAETPRHLFRFAATVDSLEGPPPPPPPPDLPADALGWGPPYAFRLCALHDGVPGESTTLSTSTQVVPPEIEDLVAVRDASGTGVSVSWMPLPDVTHYRVSARASGDVPFDTSIIVGGTSHHMVGVPRDQGVDIGVESALETYLLLPGDDRFVIGRGTAMALAPVEPDPDPEHPPDPILLSTSSLNPVVTDVG